MLPWDMSRGKSNIKLQIMNSQKAGQGHQVAGGCLGEDLGYKSIWRTEGILLLEGRGGVGRI